MIETQLLLKQRLRMYIMTSCQASLICSSNESVAVRLVEGLRRFKADGFELSSHLVASHLRAFRPLPFHPSVLKPHFHLLHKQHAAPVNKKLIGLSIANSANNTLRASVATRL